MTLAGLLHRARATITPDTELTDALCDLDREALPFWIEDATGHYLTDAQYRSMRTVGDVLRWCGVGAA